MDDWNANFLLGWPIFGCYVSFGEGISFSKKASQVFRGESWKMFESDVKRGGCRRAFDGRVTALAVNKIKKCLCLTMNMRSF